MRISILPLITQVPENFLWTLSLNWIYQKTGLWLEMISTINVGPRYCHIVQKKIYLCFTYFKLLNCQSFCPLSNSMIFLWCCVIEIWERLVLHVTSWVRFKLFEPEHHVANRSLDHSINSGTSESTVLWSKHQWQIFFVVPKCRWGIIFVQR